MLSTLRGRSHSHATFPSPRSFLLFPPIKPKNILQSFPLYNHSPLNNNYCDIHHQRSHFCSLCFTLKQCDHDSVAHFEKQNFSTQKPHVNIVHNSQLFLNQKKWKFLSTNPLSGVMKYEQSSPSMKYQRSYHSNSTLSAKQNLGDKENIKEEEFEKIFKEEKGEMYDTKFMMSLLKWWKSYLLRYSIITFIVLGAGYLVWETMSWFSSITFKSVAQWSFVTGFIMGVGCVLCTVACYRYFSLRSTLVYNAALRKVLASQEVTEKLGIPIRPSRFRAYSYVYPDVKGDAHDVSVLRQMMFWKPVRLQMIFQIQGSKGTSATVSLEASRKRGINGILGRSFVFHSLVISIPDDEDTFVMKGELGNAIDTSKLHFQ